MHDGNASRTIVSQPLTRGRFASFGAVIEHAGEARRYAVPDAFNTDGSASEQRLWVSRVTPPVTLPLRLEMLERHPHSSQFFVPLAAAGYLVVACPTLPDGGGPDLRRLEAFVAGPHQGVVYGRGIWHYQMVALGAPAIFVVSMAQGCTDDDVFVDIGSVSVTVVAPLSAYADCQLPSIEEMR